MVNNPSMRVWLQEEFVSFCLVSATCVQEQPLLLQLYVACTPQSELSGVSQHAVYHRFPDTKIISSNSQVWCSLWKKGKLQTTLDENHGERHYPNIWVRNIQLPIQLYATMLQFLYVQCNTVACEYVASWINL